MDDVVYQARIRQMDAELKARGLPDHDRRSIIFSHIMADGAVEQDRMYEAMVEQDRKREASLRRRRQRWEKRSSARR